MATVDEELAGITAQIKLLTDALVDWQLKLEAAKQRLETFAAPYREEVKKLEDRKKKLVLSTLPVCDSCNGSGIVDPGYHNVGCTCSKCGGTGRLASSI